MKLKPDVEWMAEVMADGDDDDQAKFLNEFGRVLYLYCGGDHAIKGMPMQICHIVDKLDQSGVRVIKKLYEFIELKEQEKKGV